MGIFTKIEQSQNLYVTAEDRIAKAILRKNNKVGGITLANFKTISQNYSNQNIMALA